MIESGFDAVLPDPEKAAECYQKAHRDKNTDATFNLGLLYLNYGEFGIEPEIALKLVNEAAIKGNRRAQNHLVNLGYVNNRSEFIQAVDHEEFETEEELEEEEEEDEVGKFNTFHES